jgi:hypothetical protein
MNLALKNEVIYIKPCYKGLNKSSKFLTGSILIRARPLDNNNNNVGRRKNMKLVSFFEKIVSLAEV